MAEAASMIPVFNKQMFSSLCGITPCEVIEGFYLNVRKGPIHMGGKPELPKDLNMNKAYR